MRAADASCRAAEETAEIFERRPEAKLPPTEAPEERTLNDSARRMPFAMLRATLTARERPEARPETNVLPVERPGPEALIVSARGSVLRSVPATRTAPAAICRICAT